MRKFDLSLRSSRSSYFATFRHQLTILSKTDALDEEKWLNMLGTFVKDWFRYESHFVHGRDSLVDILKERGLLSLFFQAEDGIRNRNVTGVQTCALPISERPSIRKDTGWRILKRACRSHRRACSTLVRRRNSFLRRAFCCWRNRESFPLTTTFVNTFRSFRITGRKSRFCIC